MDGWFLMHRVELKVKNMKRRLEGYEEFLMHRVELKVMDLGCSS